MKESSDGKWSVPDKLLSLVDTINALLPQTQCTRCGYQGCKPYAQALAEGDAINKCPPGGAVTIRALADLPLAMQVKMAWPLPACSRSPMRPPQPLCAPSGDDDCQNDCWSLWLKSLGGSFTLFA